MPLTLNAGNLPAGFSPEVARRPWLLAVLALGLALRLLLACVFFPEDGFWSDSALFASWAHSLAYHGPGQFYSVAGFADYPAGYLAVLWLLGIISLRISPDDVFITRLLIKLPPILADVALALAIYFAARRVAGPRVGAAAAVTYLFNPISWFDSAIWGQIDSVGTLALTLAILALINRQSELAALSATLAVLVKPQFVILAPLIAVVLLYRHVLLPTQPPPSLGAHGNPPRMGRFLSTQGPLRLATSMVVALVPLGVLPGLLGQSPTDVVAHMLQQANQYSYASASAFNIWAIFGLWQSGGILEAPQLFLRPHDGTPIILGLSPYIIGLALFLTLASAMLWLLWKRLGTGGETVALWACSSTIALGFFVLATRMHERYAFPFFALALPLVVVSRSWLAAYFVATLGCFANIYAIYTRSDLETLANHVPGLAEQALSSPTGVALASFLTTLSLAWIVWMQVRAGAASQQAMPSSVTTGRLLSQTFRRLLGQSRQRAGEEPVDVSV